MTTLTANPAPIVAGRLVADYQDLRLNLHHLHPMDEIVGYVVRETVRDGAVIPDRGVDVAVFDGAQAYGRARDTARRFEVDPGSWAVVDTLYRCGCRS